MLYKILAFLTELGQALTRIGHQSCRRGESLTGWQFPGKIFIIDAEAYPNLPQLALLHPGLKVAAVEQLNSPSLSGIFSRFSIAENKGRRLRVTGCAAIGAHLKNPLLHPMPADCFLPGIGSLQGQNIIVPCRQISHKAQIPVKHDRLPAQIFQGRVAGYGTAVLKSCKIERQTKLSKGILQNQGQCLSIFCAVGTGQILKLKTALDDPTLLKAEVCDCIIAILDLDGGLAKVPQTVLTENLPLSIQTKGPVVRCRIAGKSMVALTYCIGKMIAPNLSAQMFEQKIAASFLDNETGLLAVNIK
ncbi:hypothetical protein STRDD11_02173 [Streptococcus sp. DD11]|nr:hypothetical protein STRDD11_02173 [Streptococcus sp. DD11]